MNSDNVIISLDQARSCGFCVSEGDNILLYGEFNAKSTDYHDVAMEIDTFLIKLINKYNPILVTIEDAYGGQSMDTYKKLGILQGYLVNTIVKRGILYQIIKTSTWQGKDGLAFDKTKNRKLSVKQQSVALAKEILGDKVEKCGIKITDDVADAVCMNYYARKNIKIVPQKVVNNL